MSHEFIDRMMEQSQAGELRSPVSETLGMHLVEFGRGEAVYEMDAREQLGNPLGVIQGGVATTGIRVAFDPQSYIAERGSSE